MGEIKWEGGREREEVERRPNAVKGLVNTFPLSLSLSGCVGVLAQAGEVMMVNALEDASQWLR